MKKFMFPAKQVFNNLCGDNKAYKLSIDIIKYRCWLQNGKVIAKLKTPRKIIISKDIGYISYFIVGIQRLSLL